MCLWVCTHLCMCVLQVVVTVAGDDNYQAKGTCGSPEKAPLQVWDQEGLPEGGDVWATPGLHKALMSILTRAL